MKNENAILSVNIISILKATGVLKERADGLKTKEADGYKEFIGKVKNKSEFLQKVWDENFGACNFGIFDNQLEEIFKKARNIAAGGNNTDEKAVKANINARVSHLISKVYLYDKQKTDKIVPLGKFTHRCVIPETVSDKSSNEIVQYHKKAYEEMEEAILQLAEKIENTRDLFMLGAALDSLFFKYLSCLPSDLKGDIRDISLYEYTKVRSAFSSLLYKMSDETRNNDKPFLLIRGDFFSIQKFIFSPNSLNKKPAKILRGKSFYVSLLSDIASLYILKELGLPYGAVMMNAAGQFSIVADNSKVSENKLNEIKENINNWLYKEFYASVSFGLSYMECSETDFYAENFSTLTLNLLKEKENEKFTQFKLWERDDYEFKEYVKSFKDKETCAYCGMEAADKKDDNDAICDKCEKYRSLGEKLIKGKYINIYEDETGIFNKYGYDFDDKKRDRAIHIMKIDLDTNDTDEAIISSDTTHYKNYAATDKDDNGKINIRTFDEIAAFGDGADMLAVLKADVDNLGLIFALGLSEKNEKGEVIEKRLTFSKINTLSRSIHNFFSYYLYNKAKEEKLNIYTVFAGGDDLFIAGKYNDIVRFAKILHNEFKKFTGHNKEITISAGIGLFKSETPIWFMAEETEKLLEKAKSYGKADETNGKKDIYKGNIAILYTVCDYNKFLKEYDKFTEYIGKIEETDASKSFYYSIMEFCDMSDKYKKEKDFNNLMWKSRFRYAVSRMEKIDDEFVTYLAEIIEEKPMLTKTLIALRLYDLRKSN